MEASLASFLVLLIALFFLKSEKTRNLIVTSVLLRVRKNITSRIVSFGKGVNADRWCSSRLGRHRVAEYAIDPFPGQPL